MAEDNKFTFSDKIKNSKPASSPFSKRVSSKIGANGKPKQTLFERTRRDAPFFIAAAAALLMLPFLYKYSGTVNEAPIITPGSDSVFEPERFDYDPTGDPSGDIMQLAGRDPLSLIKGARTGEDEEDYPERYDIDDYGRETPSVSSPEPYRKAAPAATRAAFQRTFTPTKINEMRSAGMNLRGGGGIGTRFGGAELRRAARQRSASGPARGTKPVSLTPLRAAGSPTRSYFGQGGAAQARASRDAMSKANAPAALRDAMFAPVENGKLAGLGTGAFGPGGGPGKFDRNMNFKGITPWWWDMMKQQEMEKWKWRYFLFRKPLAEGIATVMARLFDGLANVMGCLVFGNADGDADYFLGGAPGEAKEGQCQGVKSSEWSAAVAKGKETGSYTPFGSFPSSEDNCRRAWNLAPGSKVKYERGSSVVGGKGPWGARISCLGGVVASMRGTQLKDRFNCEAINTTRNFELQATGKATNWHKYHAVVVKNEVPFKVAGKNFLCGNANIRWNKQDGSGVGNMAYGSSERNAQTMRHAKGKAIPNPQEHLYGGQDEYSMGLVGSNSNDYCVIYVAEGAVFNWDNFKVSTEMLLDKLNPTDQYGKAIDGLTAFPQLKLEFIEGYAMKNTLSRNLGSKGQNVNGRDTGKKQGMPLEMLPMKYVEFETAYVLHRSRSDGKYRENAERSFAETYEGKDGSTRTTLTNDRKESAIRTSCAFATFRIEAEDIPQDLQDVTAVLNFAPEVHGKGGQGIDVTVAIPAANIGPVKAELVSGQGTEGTQQYRLPSAQLQQLQKFMESQPAESVTTVKVDWKAEFLGKTSESDKEYSAEKGSEEVVLVKDCEPGTTQSTTVLGCEQKRVCGPEGVWGDWDPKSCPEAKKTVVGFFPSVGAIVAGVKGELDPVNRTLGANNTANKQFGACQELSTVGAKKLLLVDSDVKDVLARAKQKYDAANQGVSTLSYDENDITVANLLDALTILQDEQLPINTVCMLGKTIGAASRDPQIRSANNMFGTFAAYTGEDSSFFPALYKTVNGKKVVDQRFQGCYQGKEVRGNKRYHYGHYNWNADALHDQAVKGGQDDRVPFVNELANGIWRGAPLAPIAEAVNYQRQSKWDMSKGSRKPQQSMDGQNRERYHAMYNNVYFTKGSCKLNGNMSYANVQQYIEALCTNGALSEKPTNGNQLACNRRFLADTYTAVED